MYKVTKEFKFCAAHRLMNYKGNCLNLHGHNYRVLITISRRSLITDSNMVVDFKVIKENIGSWIDTYFDHAMLLNKEDEKLIAKINDIPTKAFLFNGDPTAEAIAKTIHSEILHLDFLNSSHHIFKVVVYETETSYAEYSEFENA